LILPNPCPKNAMLLAQLLLLDVISSHNNPQAGQVAGEFVVGLAEAFI